MEVYEGMILQGLRIDLPDQYVYKIEHDSPGEHIRIITDQIDWWVPWDSFIRFPARSVKMEIRDWRGYEWPRADQVFPGDILPSPKINRPDESDTKRYNYWYGGYQVVSRVYRDIAPRTMVIVTHVPAEERTIYKWHALYEEPLVFKRAPRLSKRALRSTDRSQQTEYGPYKYRGREADYMFLVHKTGRGRWPQGTPPFRIVDEPGSFTMRPPTYKYWRFFDLQRGGTRHPSDPRT